MNLRVKNILFVRQKPSKLYIFQNVIYVIALIVQLLASLIRLYANYN